MTAKVYIYQIFRHTNWEYPDFQQEEQFTWGGVVEESCFVKKSWRLKSLDLNLIFKPYDSVTAQAAGNRWINFYSRIKPALNRFGEWTLSYLFRYQLIMKKINASHYLHLILVHMMSFQMAIGYVERIEKHCHRKITVPQEPNANYSVTMVIKL